MKYFSHVTGFPLFLGNAVARGIKRAPDALTVSSDGRCLAFVGPSEYIVTIADASCLDEVFTALNLSPVECEEWQSFSTLPFITFQRSQEWYLKSSEARSTVAEWVPLCVPLCRVVFVQLLHVDVSILDVESPHLDSALKVCFSPASAEHLLVATSANKILWISTKTGRLLREVTPQISPDLCVNKSLVGTPRKIVGLWTFQYKIFFLLQITNVHKHQCASLAVSEDNRFLLTAGHNAVKVWDYNMQLHINSQVVSLVCSLI